jgi:hypothetical protein
MERLDAERPGDDPRLPIQRDQDRTEPFTVAQPLGEGDVVSVVRFQDGQADVLDVPADVLLQQREHRLVESLGREQLDQPGVDIGAKSAQEDRVVLPRDPLVIAAAARADELQPR